MKKIIIIAIILLTFSNIKAQDGQLSYIYASPLSINPAYTGYTSGAKWRAMTTMRKQWSSFLYKGISNYAFSFDAPFTDQNIALGVLFNGNSASNGAINSISGALSFSYSTLLQYHSKTKLAFGLQAGFDQKSFDPTQLTFDNQYVPGIGFNPNLDNREHFSKTSKMYPDFSFGTLLYTQKTRKKYFYPWVGIAAYHLTEPNEAFYSSGESKLPRKYILTLGAKILSSDIFSISPQILAVRQANIMQVNAGGTILLDFNQTTALSFGAFYRTSDAAIAMLGLDYEKFSLQFVYDFTTSSLSSVTQNFGGYEITLKYEMKTEKRYRPY